MKLKLFLPVLLIASLIWPQFALAEQPNSLKIVKVQIKDISREPTSKCSAGAEFVLIKNISQQVINLNNWVLRWKAGDTDTSFYQVSQESLLEPNQQAVFYNNLFNLGNHNCQSNIAAQAFINSQQLSFEIASVQSGRLDDDLDLKLLDADNNIIDYIKRSFDNNDNDTIILNLDDFSYTELNRANQKLAYGDLVLANDCQGIELSEIAVYTDQPFIEFHNTNFESASLENCQLIVNQQSHALGQIELAADGYFALLTDQIGLDLGQNSLVQLFSQNGEPIDQYGYNYNQQIDQASLSFIDNQWKLSYKITPNQANIWQQLPDCQPGYGRDQNQNCRLLKPALEISEVNYDSPKKRQFIEIHNLTNQSIDLTDFKIINNWHQEYLIADLSIEPNQYLALFYDQTKLDFDHQASNQINLISFDNQTVIDQQTFSPLSQDKSWVKIDGEWDWTFQPTPNLVNQLTKQQTCKAGYHWDLSLEKCRVNTIAGQGSGQPNANNQTPNEIQSCQVGYEIGYTGTCVKKCGPNQYRSKETNRCRNYQVIDATLASVVTKPSCQAGYEIGFSGTCVKKCGPNQYRSKTTNRCRNYQTVKTGPIKKQSSNQCKSGYEIGYTGTCVKKCQAGFARSKQTNRCRKQAINQINSTDEKAIDSTGFEPPPDQPKIEWLKLVNNPLFGAIIGISGTLIYINFGKK